MKMSMVHQPNMVAERQKMAMIAGISRTPRTVPIGPEIPCFWLIPISMENTIPAITKIPALSI